MKSKFLIILSIIFLILQLPPVMNALGGALLLLETGRSFIPDNSSIFYFNVTVVDDGSGGYWRYGEDRKNYYYFSESEDLVYYHISRNNTCKNFDPHNFKTWCNPIKMYHKEN